MFCSKRTDKWRAIGWGMMEDSSHPMDDGLGELDDGLAVDGTHGSLSQSGRLSYYHMSEDEFRQHVMVMYAFSKTRVTLPKSYNDLSRLLLTTLVLPKRFTLKDICETHVFWEVGTQNLGGFSLDVEWTLLEEWGYNAPVVHEDLEREVDKWDTLHASHDDLKVRDSVLGGGRSTAFLGFGDEVEAMRQKLLKAENGLKLVWPSLMDRILYREGFAYLTITCSRMGFGVKGGLFDSTPAAMLVLTFRHSYILGSCLREALQTTDFSNQRFDQVDSTKTDYFIKLERDMMHSQTLTIEAFGPHIEMFASFNYNVFMVRVFLSLLDDDGDEHCTPALVSLSLELDEDHVVCFDLEKSLQPAWLDTLGLDAKGLYYFYMDPDFDGNLNTLWTGDSKTYNFSRFDTPRFKAEVDTDMEVRFCVTVVSLNHLCQQSSTQSISWDY